MICFQILLSDGVTVVDTLTAESEAQIALIKAAGAVLWRGRVFVLQPEKSGYRFQETVVYIDS